MTGCSIGRLFQATVAGGSYQEGLVSVVQGLPPGISITEQDIYADMLLRKPGADELSSPRKEPDLPIIYSGVNASDTIEGAGNAFLTNGTPLTILIPNLDRHFIHIKQYQDTNRTPRPGHASYASFIKYGPCDDAIGAGIFSGRYTSAIVAAGCAAKAVLSKLGIRVFSYVKELAGVACADVPYEKAYTSSENYKRMRRDFDPFYQRLYVDGKIRKDMRFLEKLAIFADVEKNMDSYRDSQPAPAHSFVKEKYGVHHILNCPDLDAAIEMVKACNRISAEGDSAGGVIELVALGVPPGVGEPVFAKLDAELGRLLGIGAVKGVEVGAGFKVKDMTGSQCNDQMRSQDGRVLFDSNNAGGVTGGLSTGQEIIARLAVKPTPTIAKTQHTIDKYSLENKILSAITRRDPTIVARVWPVAEALGAIILLDLVIINLGYQTLRSMIEKEATTQ